MAHEYKIQGSLRFTFLFALIGLLLSTTYFMSQFKAVIAISIAAGIVIFLVAFLNTNIALSILILSMLLSPEIGSRTVSGQGMTLRLEDFLLLLVGLAWIAKNAYFKESEELGLVRKTPLNPYIIGYLVACAFSTAMGMIADRINMRTGFFFVLKYFEYIILYFILVNHLHDKKQVKNYTTFMLLTCLIVCIVAIMQIPGGMRVTAPFEGVHGEPNTLGGYLVLMLSIVLGLFFTSESLFQKSVLGVFSIIITIVFLYTLSRTSWIAAFSVMIVLMMLLKGMQRVIAFLILTAALTILVLLVPDKVKNRISETFVNKEISMNQARVFGLNFDQSATARISDWKNGLRDWLKNHFLLGYGVTGYSFMDVQYVKIAVETGIIGLITFLLLIKAIFKHAWLSYKKVKSPFFKGLSVGYIAGLVGLIFHGLGANTFIIVRIMEPFWFLTGMVIMLPELEGSANEDQVNIHSNALPFFDPGLLKEKF